MAFNRNSQVDLDTLKTEATNDPNGYGYAAVIEQTANLLDLFNQKRSTIKLDKPRVGAADIRSATSYQGYNTLTQDEQEWLRWMTGSNGFEEELVVVTADFKLQLTGSLLISDPNYPVNNNPNNSLWAASQRTDMVAAMLALIEVDSSRMEELFGFGTTISSSDWFAARDQGNVV